MRTGYVVTGVVFLSLGTIFGLVAMFLGVFYGIANAGGTFCGGPGVLTPVQTAICDAYTFTIIITVIGAFAFYLASALFLWNGFKAQPPARIVTVTQPVLPLCPNCKAQVNPGQKFCHICGAKLA